jgi:hypothetical protein
MLEFLRGKGRERKHCLFDAACLRRIWHLLQDVRSRQAVEVLERYADGKASLDDLAAANEQAEDACNPRVVKAERAARWAASAATMRPRNDPGVPSAYAADAVTAAAKRSRSQARVAERVAQACLLRDLFGPLSFREVRLVPAWLTWNDGAVVKLAQAIYDERILPEGLLDQSRLAILADALEETGCDNEEILVHFRQRDAVHVRGCWLIDLILCKQ